jgi:hypothetical protein
VRVLIYEFRSREFSCPRLNGSMLRSAGDLFFLAPTIEWAVPERNSEKFDKNLPELLNTY